MFVLQRILFKLAADQLLNLLENLDVVLSYKSHSTPSPASSCSSANAVHVVFAVAWDVEVDDYIYRRNIKSTRGYIGRNHYASLTCLKLVQ
jgi:hypothetical protein